VNYNGFNFAVSTMPSAMLWASGLSAFFAPVTTSPWPMGRRGKFPTYLGQPSHDGGTPLLVGFYGAKRKGEEIV
jgi:hypothetical protein